MAGTKTTLPTHPSKPLADSIFEDMPTLSLPEIMSMLGQGSVGTIEAKKIESDLRFDWVKNPKGDLRGVIYKTRGSGEKRQTIEYIGKGRTLKERHPLYDHYERIYKEEPTHCLSCSW